MWRLAKEFCLEPPLSSLDPAKNNNSEAAFRKIQSHYFENESLHFKAKFTNAIKGEIEVDVSFADLRMKEPIACAKYIREYIAEDRRGRRPLNKWADSVLKPVYEHVGMQRKHIFFGTVESKKFLRGVRLYHVRYDHQDEEDLDFDQLKESLKLYEQFKELDARRSDENAQQNIEAILEPRRSSRVNKNSPDKVEIEQSHLDSTEEKTVVARGKKTGTEKADVEPIPPESSESAGWSTGANRGRAQKYTLTTIPESYDRTRMGTRSQKGGTENVDTRSSRQESKEGMRTIVGVKKGMPGNIDANTIHRESRKRTRMANERMQMTTRRQESPQKSFTSIGPFSARAQTGTKSWEWIQGKKQTSNVTISKKRKCHKSMTFRRILDHIWKDGVWYFKAQFLDKAQSTLEEFDMPFLKLREEEPASCAKYIREYISEHRRGERPLNTWAKSVLDINKPSDVYLYESPKPRTTENLNNKYVSRRVAKEFQVSESGIFFGTVESTFVEEDKGYRLWHIIYDDGDEEDMYLEELKQSLGFYEQCKKLDHRQNLKDGDLRGNAKSPRSKSKVSHRESSRGTPNAVVNSLKKPNSQPHAKLSGLHTESSCGTSGERIVKTRTSSLKDKGNKNHSAIVPPLLEVEEFRNRRINGDTGKEEYLIKWKGFPESSNTWEALSDTKTQNGAKKWWKQETIRRNNAVLMSSDNDTEDEVKVTKDPAMWRKKIANYKLVAREPPKASNGECGERENGERILNVKTPNGVHQNMLQNAKNLVSNVSKHCREEAQNSVVNRNEKDNEMDKVEDSKRMETSNHTVETFWSNTRRTCPDPSEETRKTTWSSLAIQKCLKCPRVARKDCIGLLCIRCCTDKTCVAHEEQRAKTRWKVDVTSGTTQIQQAAKTKRARKLVRGRFRESEFQYINDTVVLWDLRTVLEPEPPQSSGVGSKATLKGAPTDDKQQSETGKLSSSASSDCGKTAPPTAVSSVDANNSSASSSCPATGPVSVTAMTNYKNGLKIKEDILVDLERTLPTPHGKRLMFEGIIVDQRCVFGV
eukprot:CAMPEP_0172358336 /NCGR_PEP_ID=MMETSP1060-20121228/2659_1 /TAXON_ID=37318 /ORGANISM="Pseudo-nitzschia pungens, Strain cf. cingulata" /LENGTH=1040 /DNA_ID=CAMNT_0013079501 /DNA_START=152 /DNA_END=3275 /DNA_ORIENTATION=-